MLIIFIAYNSLLMESIILNYEQSIIYFEMHCFKWLLIILWQFISDAEIYNSCYIRIEWYYSHLISLLNTKKLKY